MESNQASINKISPPTSFLNALMSFQNDIAANVEIAKVIFPLIYQMTPEKAQELIKRNIEELHKAPEKIRDMLKKIKSESTQNDLNKSSRVGRLNLQKNGNIFDKSLEKYATGKLKNNEQKTLTNEGIKKHDYANSTRKAMNSLRNNTNSNLFSNKNNSSKSNIDQLRSLVVNIAKAKTYAEKEKSLKQLVALYFNESNFDESSNAKDIRSKASGLYERASFGKITEQTTQMVIKSILQINAFFPVFLHYQNKIRSNMKKKNKNEIKGVFSKEGTKDKKDQPK